jgi:hypothetical protein
MTGTLEGMTKKKRPEPMAEEKRAEELVRRAPRHHDHLTLLRAAVGYITLDGGFVSKRDRGRLMMGPSCPAGSY